MPEYRLVKRRINSHDGQGLEIRDWTVATFPAKDLHDAAAYARTKYHAEFLKPTYACKWVLQELGEK